MTRKPVCLVLGAENDSGLPDPVGQQYISTADQLLALCRKLVFVSGKDRIWTNRTDVVAAFSAMHRNEEIELFVQLTREGQQVLEFRFDIGGNMIEPWPDEFFEINFYLMFEKTEQ